MCNKEQYINLQTGEELDWIKVSRLKDNAMLKVKPELWVEWNFEKNRNLGLDIWKVNSSLDRVIARWICEICKSEYNSKITNRLNEVTCNKCNNKITKKRSKRIKLRKYSPLSNLTDSKSYPEKFIYYLLKQTNLDFVWETSFEWSEKKRYDFYIPSLNMIIEVHGGQHYKGGFEHLGGRNLEEEQENDQLKERLARENGIDHYVVIDARESTMEWMKSSVTNFLTDYNIDVSIIDYDKIELNIDKSLILKACEYWNNGLHNISKISNKMHISKNLVSKYLEIGKKNKLCDYKKSNNQGSYSCGYRKRIIKLDNNLEIIKIYQSAESAMFDLNKDKLTGSSVKKNCGINYTKKYLGFYWAYEENYSDKINIIKNELSKKTEGKINYNDARKNSKDNWYGCRKIIQFTKDNKMVKIWDSIQDATNFYVLKTSSNISACCMGRQKTAKGFKWVYEDDYINNSDLYKNIMNSTINKRWKRKRIIYQLTLENTFIRSFNSITEASEVNKVHLSAISNCCRGNRYSASGYKWMYMEDYEKYIEERSKLA